MTTCPFCEIVAGIGPVTLLARNPGTWVIEPLNPVTPGHALVIPTRHAPDALADQALTGEVFRDAAAWAARKGRPCNLLTSVGPEATQTVRHLHVHYVPRATGDGLRLPWSPP